MADCDCGLIKDSIYYAELVISFESRKENLCLQGLQQIYNIEQNK